MAYQARGRDPLFDSNMQAAIERRGKELIGIALIVLGLMAAAMIASYVPEDPSWLSATDAPVQNWMGRFGASIAAPLYMIVGRGAWAVPVVLLAWGLRFTLHQGEDRALPNLIFSPIWIALVSVYAAGQPVGPDWTYSYGMGGLFGDMLMGSLLNLLPVGAELGLTLMMLVLGAGIVAMGAFVLGFTFPEVRAIIRFLIVGVIMVYATLMALLGRGAHGAVYAAQSMQARNADRRERARIAAAEAAQQQAAEWEAAEAARYSQAAPSYVDDAPQPEPEKTSFLSRMPSLIRRTEPMPEPELIEPVSVADVQDAPAEDRIRAKITNVIRNRTGAARQAEIEKVAPLTKGRGRKPDPLIVDPHPHGSLPPEPPLTARGAAGLKPEPPLTARAAAPHPTLPPAPQDDAFIDVPAEDEDDLGDYDDYRLAAFQPVEQPFAAPQPVQRKQLVQPSVRKPIQPSRRAQAEAQPQLKFEDSQPQYELPPLNLLLNPDQVERHVLSDEALEENARMLETVLDDYGIKGEIVSVRPGPVVTMYELEPAPGLKASRVIGLADDIARSMSALSARVSTVPGRTVIGIELPNADREMVALREILSARDYGDGKHKLPLALGKDIGGEAMVANLAKMPHLLIAGTTGSGKSVAINTMILSLLYKLTPDDCRLIMIDPKMLELSVYDGIPHLLSPVVTDPKKAVVALKWVVAEMEERYRKMSKMGVRNIDGYNSRVEDALSRNEMFERTVQTGFDEETGDPIFETEEFEPKKMPYIVVIVDEMADLMMVAGKEIEACIQRLAQMARASGIHLIMATQRPSVDVITGTIKANFPTRISFQVTSKIDSRTILGEMGAEQLLGMGDMLYMAGGSRITRCHGPFVSDTEVEEVVNFLKAYGPPDYVSGVLDGPDDDKADSIDAVLGLNTGGNTDGEDALYDQAVAIVIKDRKCSTSYIQRKLAIGYNKAARLVEQMEDQGVVSAANHVGKREILVPEQ
ncbi:DNA translocase FtsK 4TM domain-containing protein [Mesobacterium sp. TK19101]|uniref:DNA translocase FtsK n=1 Tax=Mesobacterium hydrothermale TaxID=3111907 RepID=A0ABU6HK77_9RHOB|nr:DNA translocase FtsK 4TM domain-containing protein [Mesobacterium sp. TK19101]MEC3861848.1 DNA translocase FtsK 4TM domain-containing protein [Mesobacterium sp. TK19101]